MENKDYSVITELDLPNKQLNELPDLSKYTNLEKLKCNNNYLTNTINNFNNSFINNTFIKIIY